LYCKYFLIIPYAIWETFCRFFLLRRLLFPVFFSTPAGLPITSTATPFSMHQSIAFLVYFVKHVPHLVAGPGFLPPLARMSFFHLRLPFLRRESALEKQHRDLFLRLLTERISRPEPTRSAPFWESSRVAEEIPSFSPEFRRG
jgi:hypothetical protein